MVGLQPVERHRRVAEVFVAGTIAVDLGQCRPCRTARVTSRCGSNDWITQKVGAASIMKDHMTESNNEWLCQKSRTRAMEPHALNQPTKPNTHNTTNMIEGMQNTSKRYPSYEST